MDQYARAVAEYLKEHVGVQDVKYVQGKPATMSDIQAWEDANSPFKLPEDLKAFLLSSDGFKMTWDVLFKQEVHHLGNMHINSLAEIKKMPMMLVPHDDADDDDLLVVPPGSVWDPRREDDGGALSVRGDTTRRARSTRRPPPRGRGSGGTSAPSDARCFVRNNTGRSCSRRSVRSRSG